MDALIKRRYRLLHQTDIDTINRLFTKYEINTVNKISAFLAHAARETSIGTELIEGSGAPGDPTRRNIHA
jgi:hypothetical protein